MVKKQTEVRTAIKKYLKNLSNDVTVEKVLLFGSYARGNPHEDSDVDIAVISPDFAGMSIFEKAKILGRALRGTDSLIESLGYSPEEFTEEDTPSPLISLIRNTGKVVHDSGGGSK